MGGLAGQIRDFHAGVVKERGQYTVIILLKVIESDLKIDVTGGIRHGEERGKQLLLFLGNL